MLAGLLLLGAISMSDTVHTASYHPIVIDAETKMRIRDAKVIVDDSVMKTSWDGSFTISKPYRRITISKAGYLSRNMNKEEREDTIVLINNGHKLDEVVVIGHAPKVQMTLKMYDPDELPSSLKSSPSIGVSLDFFKVLDSIVNFKKNKRRKKVIKILKDYSASEEASQ